MHCEGKLKLRSHNTSYCLIEVVTKAGLTVSLNQIKRRSMVFNATFKNISVTSWWSVLLVDETGVPRENHQPATSH